MRSLPKQNGYERGAGIAVDEFGLRAPPAELRRDRASAPNPRGIVREGWNETFVM
jgi:hypothetical protein